MSPKIIPGISAPASPPKSLARFRKSARIPERNFEKALAGLRTSNSLEAMSVPATRFSFVSINLPDTLIALPKSAHFLKFPRIRIGTRT